MLIIAHIAPEPRSTVPLRYPVTSEGIVSFTESADGTNPLVSLSTSEKKLV